MTPTHARGRPPASSQETLQDAAFDLFIEKSYADTSIRDITDRAGVSRATFFNYFGAKSDVFWVELDQALRQLRNQLADHATPEKKLSPGAGVLAVAQALQSCAAELEAQQVPFALTQYDMVGSVNELQASALNRFSLVAGILTGFLEESGHPTPRARAAAYALIAAAISGAQDWASAGTTRHSLQVYLHDAVLPVVAGFSPRDHGGVEAQHSTDQVL
ncbi:MAG: TetR/AcrR family transcriptional regulator [Pontimonas sp.]